MNNLTKIGIIVGGGICLSAAAACVVAKWIAKNAIDKTNCDKKVENSEKEVSEKKNCKKADEDPIIADMYIDDLCSFEFEDDSDCYKEFDKSDFQRKNYKDEIKEWLKENTEGTIEQCANAIGCAKSTAAKWFAVFKNEVKES